MDAEHLDFPEATFDRVLCSFGLMHLPDPERAAAEMARVLRPGGRLALTVWGTAGEAAFLRLLAASLRAAAGDRLPLDYAYTLRLGPPGVLEAVLAKAGFTQVTVERVPQTLTFPDAETFWDRFRAIGGLFAVLLAELPADTGSAARAEFKRRAASYREGDTLRLPAGYLVAGARK